VEDFMRRDLRGVITGLLIVVLLGDIGLAQKALTWQEVRDKFEAANPTLRAGQIGIDESRAQEITANLRPNPNLTILADQIDPFNGGPPHGPFAYLLSSGTVSQLWERQHKRGLRLESAQKATAIATSGQADLERNLLFNLRGAFVQTLQEKAILTLAKENLAYYDHFLDVNRERYKAGGIAQVDLKRLELQRVQYMSDLQTAEVNLRVAKTFKVIAQHGTSTTLRIAGGHEKCWPQFLAVQRTKTDRAHQHPAIGNWGLMVPVASMT
jgi:cobalt-zinc-cadmium efflux system outer membrane protein